MIESDIENYSTSSAANLGSCSNMKITKYNQSLSHLGPKDERKIMALFESIPILKDMFYIHKKVGEGTFSTVYLATLNTSLLDANKQYAIKHLIPTSNPLRIAQEVQCLMRIGGQDNVVGLKHCIRNKDNVVIVMPYLPHKKINSYLLSMDVEEVKLYMKNLLKALRRVHEFNVIHRDVKPSNFLYDRDNQKFLLVDFGLAEEVGKKSVTEKIAELNKKRKRSIFEDGDSTLDVDSVIQPLKKKQTIQPAQNINKTPVKKLLIDENSNSLLTAGSDNGISDKPVLSPQIKTNENNILSPRRLPLTSSSANVQNNTSPQKLPLPRVNLFADNKKSESGNSNVNVLNCNKGGSEKVSQNSSAKKQTRVFQTLLPTNIGNKKSSGSSFLRVVNSQVKPVFTRPNVPSPTLKEKETSVKCECDGKPQVCNKCLVRKRQVASRAGTPGFRPPEVLLKHPLQTTAVDIWAAGVIFLSILSGCYPFFKSTDDMTSLAEIMAIFGSTDIKKLASKFGKRIRCSFLHERENLEAMCERLRCRKQEAVDLQVKNQEPTKCQKCFLFDFPIDRCGCQNTNTNNSRRFFPESAYDLLSRMLDVNPETRINANEALNHPFFVD